MPIKTFMGIEPRHNGLCGRSNGRTSFLLSWKTGGFPVCFPLNTHQPGVPTRPKTHPTTGDPQLGLGQRNPRKTQEKLAGAQKGM